MADRMIARVVHRGPDRQNVQIQEHVALACARLSIVDLSAAADQPLVDSSGDLTIVFNGEIYNYKEVRIMLEEKGHRFRSHSDTEVVLRAYQEWGVDCHQHFNGMWAFAIWDRPNRHLLLSRDRFGVKPLYVVEQSDEIFFASEIKALLAAGVPAALAADAFNSYCGGESMFAGVHPVPQGTWIRYRVDSPTPVRRTWWRTEENLVEPPPRYADRVGRFRDLFVDAVRVRLRADVLPVVTLSGGLDSSSVYAACQLLSRDGRALSATEETPLHVPAYTVTFPGSSVDEAAFATSVANHFGENVLDVHVTPDNFRALVERTTWHQEGLVWNSSVLSYHELYRQLADRGVRVVLEGHGGDELLAGYATFADDAVGQRVRALRLPSAWSAARAAARTHNAVLGHSSHSPLRAIAGAAARAMLPGRILATLRRPRISSAALIDPELATPAVPFAADLPALSPLKRALHAAFHTRVLPTILRVNDRATMAASIESRSPFLDYRLVSYAFSLPDDDVLGRGWTKRILRDSMKDVLPHAIVWREKKLPFIAPQPEWFRSPGVVAAFEEALVDGTISRTPGANARTFQQMLHHGVRNGFSWRESNALWMAYSYAIWNDIFLRSTAARTPTSFSSATV